MLKKMLFASIGLIIIASIIGISGYHVKQNSFETFDVNDYKHKIEKFYNPQISEIKIEDAKTAKKAAYYLIKRTYEGDEKEREYDAFYDAQADVWLVKASVKRYFFVNTKGEDINVLMNNSSNNIIALWL